MPKPVKSIRHIAEKRAHTPSSEEAGYEEGNAFVKDGDKQAHYPKSKAASTQSSPIFIPSFSSTCTRYKRKSPVHARIPGESVLQ